MASADRAIRRDTIAAIASPPGRGGIGVVRVSGPAVVSIAHAVLGRLPLPRQATFSLFRDKSGDAIDRGIALYFPAPASYTGEDVLELQGHGGPVVLGDLLGACIDAGSRLADPGEFTRRAFLEGKLDLAQAEAVADLIAADTRNAARGAMRSLSGEFSQALRMLVGQLTELRALTEAMLDFPEEDVDAIYEQDATERLSGIAASLGSVLARSRQGSLLRSGIQVVLAGRPNVGKSSLFNRLAGEERAIVTAVPGTTRDALRERIQIDGVPATVIDTAGLHESKDEIEMTGMARTRQELAHADIVVEVFDAAMLVKDEASLPEAGADATRLRVYNKADLVPEIRKRPVSDSLWVSARTGEGIAELRKAILLAAGWRDSSETVFVARERHLRALARAASHLEVATRLAKQWEFFAEELRLAQQALGAITGEVSADDLLGEIFSRFCIGK